MGWAATGREEQHNDGFLQAWSGWEGPLVDPDQRVNVRLVSGVEPDSRVEEQKINKRLS